MKRVMNFEVKKFINQRVRVCGWVNAKRDHGKLIFIDMRDRSGILQVVSDSEISKEIKPEYVLEVEGIVRERSLETRNPTLETGDVELVADRINILARAKPLPFRIDTDGYEIGEEIRLKYRYVDLRRRRMVRNLELRHKTIKFMRDWLDKRGFIEIETPILSKHTPEGARDFIVPSRLQPGKFYALPQSPQQYKQILMVAGFEKYYQIARCFRDEDPRADRAYGEFTQLDIEMSFVTQEDILNLIEELFIDIVKNLLPHKHITEVPFPRISYQEAIEKYQSDKPDIRKNKNDKNELGFCFIVDWPLFEKTVEKEINPMHHPFTCPKEEDIPLLETDPMRVKSWQHDFVLNGYEIGGGSIRITDPDLQMKIFKILGYREEEIKIKFGHLLEAFQYGVPPHGGIAPGIDRFLMVISGEPSIREVVAFPITSGGQDLMMDSPVKVEKEKLNELGLDLKHRDEG